MAETCVSIDLEMTSARPENQEVIEIAAIKFRGERVLESWSTLVRPQGEVPYGTQVLTGIDPRALERAPVLRDVADQLVAFVGTYPLVAHTVSADVGCLRRQGVILDNPQYDTFELASILLPQMPSYSLASLAQQLGIPFPQQHRAAQDALVTKQLFLKLLEIAESLDLGLIQEINRLLGNHPWPLKRVFREIEIEKSRHALGSSIRATMAAKAGLDQTDLELLLSPGTVDEPLRPKPEPEPIDPKPLVDLLRPGGLFEQRLPGYEHREPQITMMQAVARALNEGGRLIVEAGTGTGKALDVDTPIPTPTGWTRLGDLKAGDRVFDENGSPCTVVVAWPVMKDRLCYEVVFSDGSILVADHEHLWASYTWRDRTRGCPPNRAGSRQRCPPGSPARLARVTDAPVAPRPGSTATISRAVVANAPAPGQPAPDAARALPEVRAAGQRVRLDDAWPSLDQDLEGPRRLARDRRDRAASPYTVLTTEEMFRTLATERGELNHAIGLAKAVQYPNADLPVEPYDLGVWLGDGSSRGSRITTADPAVVQNSEAAGYATRKQASPGTALVGDGRRAGKSRQASGLTEKLRCLGVLSNQHIPTLYLTAAEDQRRALLAGLLDSNGTVSRTGAIEFVAPSQRLAEDVHELVCSLGYRGTIRVSGQPRTSGGSRVALHNAAVTGWPGTGGLRPAGHSRDSRAGAVLGDRDGGPHWVVTFTTADSVFRVGHKRRLHRRRGQRSHPERSQYRYVVAVRLVASRPVRCITVDSPSQLYLAGKAFIPTHNSVAYLLPSIYFATKNNQRVVVSTNTINLQDQLIQKDLPDLQRVLPVQFRATVVKGRTNYLCLQRLASLRRRTDLSLVETLALIKILVWLPITETGDQSELNLTDAERLVWQKLYAHPDMCTLNTCQYAKRGRCFLYRARARAEASHIVVVNHALLLSDVASASRVLPEYQYLIVDEAHHLEDEATDQLGYVLQARDVFGFLDDLMPASGTERRGGLLAELPLHFRGSSCPAALQRRAEELARDASPKVNEARAALDAFFQTLAAFMAQRPVDNRGYEQRARLTRSARTQPAWSQVEVAWETVELRLIELQEAIGKLYSHLEGLDGYGLLEYDELLSQLASLLSFGERLRTEGNAIVSNPADDRIYWVTLGAGGETSLHSAPLNVGPLLETSLYGDKNAVVMTSATLTTVGRFDYLKERLGFNDADELAVGSPFDYARSTLILLPTDLPEPEQPLYQKVLHQTLYQLCAATEGRTLVLFTSHAQLRAAHQAIQLPLKSKGILVLGHGVDGVPRRQLLNTFKTNPKTVLLGAASFWEGVDVVGDALSVLVITRIPFSVPTDPVIAARSELFDDPFSQYSLPQAILRFRQGFGRLIRSQSDRGVVVILDRRVQTKSYGPLILKSLPSCTVRSVAAAEVPRLAERWLERAKAEPRR